MLDDTPQNLVWLDLEMTGLDAQKEGIIEIATIVTDSELNILEEGPVFAIHQEEALLEGMDAWNRKYHSKSGLLDRVRANGVNESEAEAATLAFLEKYVKAGNSPLCGNSVHQDRRFLRRGMPKLHAFFHYRNLDVSTLKILAQLWAPEVEKALNKETQHEALQDIRDSINELQHYRKHLLKV